MCHFLLVSVSGLKLHPFLVSALGLGLNQKAGFGRRLGKTKLFKMILGMTDGVFDLTYDGGPRYVWSIFYRTFANELLNGEGPTNERMKRGTTFVSSKAKVNKELGMYIQ